MRTHKLVTVTTLLIVLISAAPGRSAAPQQINYQGWVVDTAGTPLDTTLGMTFRIYDAPSGGVIIWTETHPAVTVSEGTFNTMLGSVSGIAESVFSDTSRFLGVTISGDPELAPRTRLVSVPYAHRVGTIDGAVGGIVTGKLAIGPGHDNSGAASFVAGENNQATGAYSTVGGGISNRARGAYTTVSGGGSSSLADSNSAVGAWSAIGGGWRHLTSGQFSTIAGGDDHTASADYTAIGGGKDNGATATSACVAGGQFNHAGGDYAFVGGGYFNAAVGASSAIPGGSDNTATGDYTFAAGRNANILATHDGTFIFADSTNLPFYSAAANEFAVRATGGVRLVTAVDGIGQVLAGACLSAGSGSWASCSDRSLKENIRTIDRTDILGKLAALEISEWNYRAQDPAVRHIGPMAQEFHRAFGVGDDPRFITAVDADGIALAAIQELHWQLENEVSDKTRRITQLERQVLELQVLVAGLIDDRASGR